jgi:hypothetical protein
MTKGLPSKQETHNFNYGGFKAILMQAKIFYIRKYIYSVILIGEILMNWKFEKIMVTSLQKNVKVMGE